MPGPITRLLACDDNLLATCAPTRRRPNPLPRLQPLLRCCRRSRASARSYKYRDIVPTHVHPNFNTLHFADIGDNYVPYNKPGSIKHWCAPRRPAFPRRRAAPRPHSRPRAPALERRRGPSVPRSLSATGWST